MVKARSTVLEDPPADLDEQEPGGAPAVIEPPSILILFSDTGGGHRAAARALEQALRMVDPEVRVATADPLIRQGPAVVKQLTALYSPLIKRSRTAWGALYHTTNHRPTFGAVRAVFGRQVRKVVAELVQEHDPDLVVSVHPLLNHVTHQAIRRNARRRALMTVVTDLVDIHRGWVYPRSDRIVVPTEQALQACLQRRASPTQIRLLGLPTDLRFRPSAHGEKQALRRFFGLDQERFTILVAGGGEGSGRMLQQVRGLAREEHPWQLVVVCGRNERLRRRLQKMKLATRTLVLGFVTSMPELMRAADVLVSKAGPGAIGESLATGLPMVLTTYLPGQETENVSFVVDSGFGYYAPTLNQLRQVVNRLAEPNGETWRLFAERAAALSHPYAALEIAREGLGLARTFQET